MLTEEQIKNLKPGDSLDVRGTYIKRYSSGDLVVKCNITVGGKLTSDIKYFHPSSCYIPSEGLKYDPCRKLKMGDLVKKRYIYGRSCPAIGSLGIYTVVEDEDTNGGNVVVQDAVGMRHKVKAVFLELITPVEELEPHSVHTITGDNGTPSFFAVRKGDVTVAAFFCDTPRAFTEEQAKAAAEAECARLNEEWRKENNHNQN